MSDSLLSEGLRSLIALTHSLEAAALNNNSIHWAADEYLSQPHLSGDQSGLDWDQYHSCFCNYEMP